MTIDEQIKQYRDELFDQIRADPSTVTSSTLIEELVNLKRELLEFKSVVLGCNPTLHDQLTQEIKDLV